MDFVIRTGLDMLQALMNMNMKPKLDHRKARVELLLLNKDFQDDIEKIRKRWQIPLSGFKEAIDEEKWANEVLYKGKNQKTWDPKAEDSAAPLVFKAHQEQICKKFNLNEWLKDYLHSYILRNTASIPSRCAMKVVKGSYGEIEISIKLDSDATGDDIKKALSSYSDEIKRWRKEEVKQRNFVSSDYKIWKRVAELSINHPKKTNPEIAKTLSEEFGRKFDFTHVSDIKKQIKKYVYGR